MSMSRKNYVATAAILKTVADTPGMHLPTVGAVASMLADYFEQDNDLFDRDRFMRAAFGDEPASSGFEAYRAERERLGL